MKKILLALFWLIIIGGIVYLLIYFNGEHSKVQCRNIKVEIDYNKDNFLLTKDDILKLINDSSNALQGKHFSEIHSEYLLKQIYRNNYVEKACFYKSLDSTISIKIKQKKPLFRVLTHDNRSYYVDLNGEYLPLSSNYTSRVLVVSGYFNDKYLTGSLLNTYQNSVTDTVTYEVNLSDIYKLAKHIDSSRFLRSLIDQVYIRADNEIVLIPKIKNQKILLGDISNMEEKFENLFIFYKNGITRVGWDNYKEINLKFNNQVVCTKK